MIRYIEIRKQITDLSGNLMINDSKNIGVLTNNQWAFIGIALVVFYWIFESSIDVLIFSEGDFTERIFYPGARAVLTRMFVVAIIMICAYIFHRDVSQHHLAEEDLVSAKDYRLNLINSSLDMIIASNLDGKIIEFNPAAQKTFGYSKAEVLGKPVNILYATPSDTVQVKKEIMEFKKYEGEVINKRKNGENFSSYVAASPLGNFKGDVVGVMGISRDITERKKNEGMIQLQLERLKALNSIGRAMNASLDLRVTLDVMLNEVTTLLKIDAASVLLLNQHTQTLECIAKKGFRSAALDFTQLKMGEGNAGLAALEHRIIIVHNLKDNPGALERSKFLKKEDFISYIGAPLVAKGEVKGVLELFNRTTLDPQPDWLEFLDTIACQAAIAINNATLFEEVQRSKT